MRTKKTLRLICGFVLICALSLTAAFALFAPTGAVRAAAAAPYSVAGLNGNDFEIVNNKGRVAESSLEMSYGFYGVDTDYSTALAFKTPVSGEFTLDFFLTASPLGWDEMTSLVVTFGNDFLTLPDLAHTRGSSHGDLVYSGDAPPVAFGSIDNGILNMIDGHADNNFYPSGLNILSLSGGAIGNTNLYHRYVVHSNATVSIGASTSPFTGDGVGSADWKTSSPISLGTAPDGYIILSVGQARAINTVLRGLRVTCASKGINSKSNLDDWSVLGDASKFSTTGSVFKTVDGLPGSGEGSYQHISDGPPIIVDTPMLKSKFAISDEGKSAGEKVFETEFTLKRTVYDNWGATTDHPGGYQHPNSTVMRWGLVFGLSDTDEYIPANKFDNSVCFGYRSNYGGCGDLYAGDQSYPDDNARNIHNDIPMKVTGYKGGKVTVSWLCPSTHHSGTSYTEEHTLESEPSTKPIDFKGYIGFSVWGDVNELDIGCGFETGFTVKNFSFEGDVATVGGITFNQENTIKRLAFGDQVTLSGAFAQTFPTPDADTNVSFSIKGGNNSVASVTGNKLTAGNTKGNFTLCVSYGMNVEEYEGRVCENAGQMNFTDNFASGIDSDIWTVDGNVVNSSSNVVPFGTGMVFDSTSAGAVVALTNAWFAADPAVTGTVFDIGFDVHFNENYAGSGYSTGFAFGLDGSNGYGDPGVGALIFGTAGASVHNGSQQISSFSANRYFATSYLTVRLVANSDGTLDIYFGTPYFTGELDVNNLWASYSGFNFSGGIAFFSNLTGGGTYEAGFKNVSVKGRLVYDDGDIATKGGITFGQEGLIGKLAIGDQVTLSGAFTQTFPAPASEAVSYSITSGSGTVATITGGNKLNALAKGSFTLRVSCGPVSKDYTGRVYENSGMVEFADDFSSGVGSHLWDVTGNVFDISTDRTNFGKGLVFSEDSGGAVAGLKNISFSGVSGTVFDVSFDVRCSDNHAMQAGFMFGLNGSNGLISGNENAALAVYDEGVGAIVFDEGKRVWLYNGAQSQLIYNTQNSYFSMNPMTVRLVGKADGTLEIYIGRDDNSNINLIGDLYGAYAGFNVSGGAAFFCAFVDTWSTTGHPEWGRLDVGFQNVTANGRMVFDDADFTWSADVLNDFSEARYVPGMAPIVLDVAVTANPNIASISGWTLEVLSGNAEVGDNNTLVLTGTGAVAYRLVSDFDDSWYSDFNITVLGPQILFKEWMLKGIVVGDEIDLSPGAYFDTASGTLLAGATFEIVTGTAAEIDSDGVTLIAKSAGTVTLRVISDFDTGVTKDYNVTISNLTRYNYTLDENFRQPLSEDDWTVIGSGFDANGALIIGSATVSGGNNPKAVLNIPFSINPTGDNVVFDITFMAQPDERRPNAGIPYGLMFGMKNQTDNFTTAGVGAIVFNSSWADIYMGGVKMTPNYVTMPKPGSNEYYGKDYGFAYMSECPLTVRLVGMSDGTLRLYMGMAYSDYYVKIDQLFATYSGFDFDNTYLAFFSNAPAGSSYQSYIKNLSVKGNFLFDLSSVSIKEVKLGTTNLSNLMHAPVARPIILDVYVGASPNIALLRDWTATVVSGPAKIENGALITTGAGSITVRVESDYDSSKFAEHTFTVGLLEIEKITIVKTEFENVNTDTQPITLKAVVDANTFLPAYLTVTFTVVSGSAEIAGKQLRILGAGEVVLKAECDSDPSVFDTLTFTVVDADQAQYDVIEVDEDGEPKGTDGCGGGTGSDIGLTGLLALSCLAAFAGVALLRKKRA